MKNRIAAALLTSLTLAGAMATPAFADPPRRVQQQMQQQRWNGSQHNGYTLNGQWHYGPPPAAYQGRQGFQPGFRNWRRGERLPAYYRSHYRQVDYRREHLRAPPRGYHYVRDERGDTLLVAIATGLIASVILNGR